MVQEVFHNMPTYNLMNQQVTTNSSGQATSVAPITSSSSNSSGSLSNVQTGASTAISAPQYNAQGMLQPGTGGQGAPTGVSPTPLPPPVKPLTPMEKSLADAQASGPPPQDAGTAKGAVDKFAPPTPTFYKPTTPVAGYDAQTIFDANGKALDSAAYKAAGGKSDYSNVVSGNVPNTPPPITNTPDSINKALANDPGWQKIQAAIKDASESTIQKQTLLQQYTDLQNQYNIPAINAELINDKKIIDGTEDDIRHEVQAAGGFATDSQVQALAVSRNKTLIQNYNTLQAQKSDALSTINTMVGLAGQDRAFAQQAALNQLDIASKEADYMQKFNANAQEGYKNVIAAVGYAGLYKSLAHDPASLSLAEQTLGLAPGSLATIAAIPDPTAQLKAVQLAQAQTDLKYAAAKDQAQINASNASAASSAASTAKTNSELAFEKANGGMTPAEYNTQQNSIQTTVNTINNDAATLIGKMTAKTNPMSWQDAFNTLKAQHPDLDITAIDNLLQSQNYRP